MSLTKQQNQIRRALSKAQTMAKKHAETLDEFKELIEEVYGIDEIDPGFIDQIFSLNDFELDFDRLNNILTEEYPAENE
jgi:hypothetical protein